MASGWHGLQSMQQDCCNNSGRRKNGGRSPQEAMCCQPELKAMTLCTLVEPSVRAMIAGQGREEIVGPVGLLRFIGVLAIVGLAGQIVVQEPGYHTRSQYRLGGRQSHPDFAPVVMRGWPSTRGICSREGSQRSRIEACASTSVAPRLARCSGLPSILVGRPLLDSTSKPCA